MTCLLVVAGEASGDLHGGEILRALRKLDPSVRMVGVGGRRMTPFLDRKVADVADLSVMGLTEVLGHLPRLARLKRQLRAVAEEEGCTGALLIDYQEFNRHLAQDLRHHRPGMRLHQYVCPQVWAWKAGRIPKLGRLFDVLYCLFAFEPQLFTGLPVEACWLGNPLVDLTVPEVDRATFQADLGLDPTRPTVALLPGSRRSEVQQLLPILAELVRTWDADPGQPRIQWVLPVASSLDPAWVQGFLGDLPVKLTHQGLAARAYADAALVCSGTATLETALLNTPFVLFYRLSALTLWIARRVVKTPHFGLVNIVAGRAIVPELLQEEVTAPRFAQELTRLLDPTVAATMRADFREMRTRVGAPGAADRLAAHLHASLKGGSTHSAELG